MSQNIADMSIEWDDGGTVYDGIKLNVTNTASNAASLLVDLQVNSSTVFSVRKDGKVTTVSDVECAVLIANSEVRAHYITISDTGAQLPEATAGYAGVTGAATATLTNAVVAGNPVKWLTIVDNGTPLLIPAFASA